MEAFYWLLHLSIRKYFHTIALLIKNKNNLQLKCISKECLPSINNEFQLLAEKQDMYYCGCHGCCMSQACLFTETGIGYVNVSLDVSW